jgi:hypothetical protein
MIVRLPPSSGKLLSFKHVIVTNLLIESINSDAQFLFTNLKRLDLVSAWTSVKNCGFMLKDLTSMIEIFKASGSQLDFIKLDLNYLWKQRSGIKELANYPIKSIILRYTTSEYEDNTDESNSKDEDDSEEDSSVHSTEDSPVI